MKVNIVYNPQGWLFVKSQHKAKVTAAQTTHYPYVIWAACCRCARYRGVWGNEGKHPFFSNVGCKRRWVVSSPLLPFYL